MKKFKSLVLTVIGLLCSISVSAEDFEVDGIYYNITSSTDKMVEVTYRGGDYNSYTNEYSGVVIIPESVTYNGSIYSVTSIGSSAFYYCDGLTSVVIPNSVTSIGEYAFSDCYALTSVEIGNSVTDIGMYAFDSCLSLTSVVIPNSVTSIRGGAFARCSGLTSVVIPNSVTSIGSSTFEGCSGLTSVEIPNSVTSIGDWAFYGCSGLTSVEIPNSVTSIGSSAFSGCSGLTSVEIPNSVTSIGDWAFSGCDGLTSVVIPNSVTDAPAITDNLLKGTNEDTYINVPSNSKAFVLSMVDDEVGMYLAKLTDGRFLNNANKAYLLLDNNKLGLSDEELDTSVGGAQLSLRFDFGGATGVDKVQTETGVNNATYDMYGRKVSNITTPGLYIANGKKVLVK